MDRRDIAGRRLHNQRLWGPPCPAVEDVVGRMAAMQAQEFAYAKWSVAQRARAADMAAIDSAFADGAILRTHLLRPTWHFVRAADIRWMLKLSGPRVHRLNAYYYRQLELDAAVLTKSRKVLVKALDRGRHLERKELAAALARAGIAAGGLRLAYILMHAEQEAVICSGALRGKQQTYALLDERTAKAKAFTPEEGLTELTRRYFESRGPATVKDYVQWASVTVADAKRGLESLRPALQHETAGGRTYWFAEASARRPPPSPRIDLVQVYDEYVMGYGESRDVMSPTGPAIGGKIPFYHAILRDGEMVGHWRHTLEKKAAVLDTHLYRKLDRGEAQALDVAVARYGEFLGVPASLR